MEKLCSGLTYFIPVEIVCDILEYLDFLELIAVLLTRRLDPEVKKHAKILLEKRDQSSLTSLKNRELYPLIDLLHFWGIRFRNDIPFPDKSIAKIEDYEVENGNDFKFYINLGIFNWHDFFELLISTMCQKGPNFLSELVVNNQFRMCKKTLLTYRYISKGEFFKCLFKKEQKGMMDFYLFKMKDTNGNFFNHMVGYYVNFPNSTLVIIQNEYGKNAEFVENITAVDWKSKKIRQYLPRYEGVDLLKKLSSRGSINSNERKIVSQVQNHHFNMCKRTMFTPEETEIIQNQMNDQVDWHNIKL